MAFPAVSAPPRSAVATPAASAPAELAKITPRPASDAWNIGSYLPAIEDLPTPPPKDSSAPELQPREASVPIDVEAPGRLASLLHRVPLRGIRAAVASALIVVLLGAGGLKLFGGSFHADRARRAAIAGASGVTTAGAESPAPSSSAPPAATPLPSLVAPSGPTMAAPARAPAPEAEASPPTAGSDEARRPSAAPAPAKTRARPEKKARVVATKVVRHAPAARPVARRRVAARSSAATPSESDRMARAREAYRQGNERLFSGDLTGAIAAYEEMVRLNPKDAGGYRGLGLASAQLGKRTEAVRYLRAYLKHAPSAEDRALISSRISLLQTLP
jgi:tetratricopeptide (TPR) repeat protein